MRFAKNTANICGNFCAPQKISQIFAVAIFFTHFLRYFLHVEMLCEGPKTPHIESLKVSLTDGPIDRVGARDPSESKNLEREQT